MKAFKEDAEDEDGNGCIFFQVTQPFWATFSSLRFTTFNALLKMFLMKSSPSPLFPLLQKRGNLVKDVNNKTFASSGDYEGGVLNFYKLISKHPNFKNRNILHQDMV